MRKVMASCLALLVLLSTTVPASADGGPIIRQRDVWEALQEGQQIAVGALAADGQVQTDLFISLIDHTGEGHEVTFFVPLGWEAAHLAVLEEDSGKFEETLTAPLEKQLEQAVQEEHNYGSSLRWSLLAGSWVINGGWTWPLLAIFALSACASDAPQPMQVLYTESSRVSLYGIDENTDLAALIATTGLDPSVEATLRAIGGQQIAVVSMHTQPPSQGNTSGYFQQESSSQSGLHLSWSSRAVQRAEGGWEHHYPLGTGGAWARPIPLTRVYVTAPAGMGFRVEHPVYGLDLSADYTRSWYSRSAQVAVYQQREEAAYAIVQRTTPQGQVWRGLYTQANPTEDLRIIQDGAASNVARVEAANRRLRRLTGGGSWLVSIALALAVWVLLWRYVMPARLGLGYRWHDYTFWRDALTYPLVNGLILGLLYGLVSFLSRWPNLLVLLLVVTLGAAAVLLALPISSLLFARRYPSRKAEAVKGYWIVAALANVGHLGMGALYAMALGRLLR